MRAKRSEMMVSELEAVALWMFETRGFDDVTVDEIASEAQISVRTFYRYFPAKEDVLQVRIARRSDALRVALTARPVDEHPLQSLRRALEEVVSVEDLALLRRWSGVVTATPVLLRSVLGGIQLKSNRMLAEFFASRFDMTSDAFAPSMLAAAAGGVIQAAQTQWFLSGGDLPTMLSDGIGVLERGIDSDPRTWSGSGGEAAR